MLLERIIGTIKAYSMLDGCERVTAALSGGADSVCLLMLLCEICPSYNIALDAVHVNHCIRGDESDRDEEFCRRLCERLGIPFSAYREDVPKYAEENRLSLEEAARDVRYRIFKEHIQSGGRVATAHTASDNAETVLINLARGTGLKGLGGIPPVRDMFVRPLIEATRADVEEYLKDIGQDHITDSTNLTLDYTRNKIRHKVIPVLEEINSGFFLSVGSLSKIISEENSYIESQADKAFEKHCVNGRLSGVSELPPVILKRCIMRLFAAEGISLEHRRINAAAEIAKNGGKLNLSEGTYAVCKKGVFYISRSEGAQKELSVPVVIGKNSIFEKKILTAFDGRQGAIVLDKDCIKGQLVLRSRRFGDKIRLEGRDFTSSVKKLLNERTAPYDRPFVQFLADEEGLVYAEGFGIADRVKVTEKTTKFFSFSISETV